MAMPSMGQPETAQANACQILFISSSERKRIAALMAAIPAAWVLTAAEMDRFEVTAEIRRQEKATGRHLPIVALTAQAMKGDQERCLAAAMDGYISKTINSAELFALLDKHGSSSVTAVPTERSPN